MSSQEEIVQQLAENIERLRDFGLSSGLSDHEIDCCIERVVTKPKNVRRINKKPGICRRTFWMLFRICAALFSLLLILFVVSSVHAPTDRLVGQVLAPLSYQFFRLLRLSTLPFSKRFDLTTYYDMPCLLKNPFYEEEPPDCKACNEVKKVIILQNVTNSKFTRQFIEYHQYRPAVVQGEMEMDVTLNDIRSLFVQHLPRLGRYAGVVESNVATINTPQDLFVSTSEAQVKQNRNFHAKWISKQMATSQVVRELFQRPSFLSKEGEISLEKVIIIENSQSEAHTLPKEGMFPFVWYVQASGARHMVLTPHPVCREECKTVEVTVYQGEMLFYLEQYWTVDSHPLEDTSDTGDISIAFHGNFM